MMTAPAYRAHPIRNFFRNEGNRWRRHPASLIGRFCGLLYPYRKKSCGLSVLIPIFALLAIVIDLLVKGIPHLTPELFSLKYTTENQSMLPAIINTLLIALVALLVAIPIGVGGAIYLAEYAKRNSPLVRTIRLTAETLQGDAAILDILRRCGAVFTRTAEGISFEKAPLHGVDIDLADCPDLGPVLMVLGLLCEGTTVIRNAERLRLKESDRIAAMEAELRACGGVLESEGGTITIHGCADSLHAPAAPLHGHNDHRVVMSLSVLALSTGIPLTVDDAEAITKSWPNFFEAIKPLGAEVEYAG